MHGSYLKADHSIDFVLKMLSKWVSTIHGSVNAFILPRQKHWGDIRSKSDLETSIVPLLAIVWQIWLGIFFFCVGFFIEFPMTRRKMCFQDLPFDDINFFSVFHSTSFYFSSDFLTCIFICHWYGCKLGIMHRANNV